MGDISIIIFYSSLFLIFLIFCLKLLLRSKTQKQKLNLPPPPPGRLPLIGHLHLLKPPAHRTLLLLAETLNRAPIFSLRLGPRLVFVISSRSVAEECFTKNDVILANRPPLIFGKHVGYNDTNMLGSPYGDHWRNLRRIAVLEIFSTHRLNAVLSVRKDEIRRLLKRLSRIGDGSSFKMVEMRPMLVDLTFNNIMRMVAGKRYYGEDVEDNAEAKRVRALLAEGSSSLGAAHPEDYFPVLRFFTNYEKRLKKLARRMDAFLNGLIEEKRAQKDKGNTMIDHLLSLQELEPEYYTDHIIKGLMLVIILAGTNTSAVTLEWALSNLLNNQDIMKKARTEIDNQIGLDCLIDESNMSRLPYLQNIFLETLRLHPATPLLIPHLASENCTVAGYDMPRGTTLLVNAWGIHRDPKLWDDPETFKPERFEREGEAQKLMPFGLGRRACPGAGLAQRLVTLTLGSLIQCFDLKRVGEENIDLKEGKGITMPKAMPLQAMFKVRPIVGKVLQENS